MMHFDTSQRFSALCGMVLIVLVQIQNEELLKTVILAGLGGTASYLFTFGIKYLIYFIRKKMK